MRVVKWALGAVALAVTAAVIAFGVASLTDSAQAEEEPNKPAVSRYEELLAQKLGISVDQLRAAQKAARDQMIDEAVAAGKITAEQAEKLKSLPLGAHPRLRGIGRGVVHAIKDVLGAAAEVLGISRDDVIQNLRNGQSLADMATAKGLSTDQLKAGITQRVTADIQQAVADGKITQEQADRLKEALSNNIDRIINHEGGLPRGGHLRFRFWGP